MAKITTLEERYAIKRMVEAGHSSRAIAEAMGLCPATVKKWRRRIGEGRLDTRMGRPRRGLLSSFDPSIACQLEHWRAAHPGWGATTLGLELEGACQMRPLPSRASIARFLRASGHTRSYQVHAGVPERKPLDTDRPHQRWQVDAEGNRPIDAVGTIALINVKDVHSRLYAGSYPALLKSPRAHPTTDHYQTALRLAFAQFGLPDQLQSDHASVFYDNTTPSPFPTRIHLWLAALGIELCYSRLHRATDQAYVERAHQTMVRQVIEGACFSGWDQLAQRLDQRRAVLNAFYPCTSLQGQAPLQAFPEAGGSARPYYAEKEPDMLDLERAFALIAQGSYFRRAAKNRTISLGAHIYYVRQATPRNEVRIAFDPDAKHLIFYDEKEQVLTTMPIKGVTLEELMGPLWPSPYVPCIQLALPLDWEAHLASQRIRLLETPMGSRLNET